MMAGCTGRREKYMMTSKGDWHTIWQIRNWCWSDSNPHWSRSILKNITIPAGFLDEKIGPHFLSITCANFGGIYMVSCVFIIIHFFYDRFHISSLHSSVNMRHNLLVFLFSLSISILLGKVVLHRIPQLLPDLLNFDLIGRLSDIYYEKKYSGIHVNLCSFSFVPN